MKTMNLETGSTGTAWPCAFAVLFFFGSFAGCEAVSQTARSAKDADEARAKAAALVELVEHGTSAADAACAIYGRCTEPK